MKRIEAGSFVLYLSDEEWDKFMKDVIKTLSLKLGVGLKEQIKEQEKIEGTRPYKIYYNVTYEELEKLFEETRIKVFGRRK
jgi:hypothetical protein